MGNDKGADWAVEAKNRRIDDFRNRQRKLALLSEDSPIIASRDEVRRSEERSDVLET